MSDDADDAPLPHVPDDWAEQLIACWFEEHGENDWFGGGAAFDALLASRFAGWRTSLREQPLAQFTIGAATALAAVILFDQLPRNIHRDTAEAFATDHIARAISRHAVARCFDTALTPTERLFLYLPFEHSEDVQDQAEAVRLISALGNDGWTEFALNHQAVIDQFGRFPHRNAALGRSNRAGEAEAVAAGAHW